MTYRERVMELPEAPDETPLMLRTPDDIHDQAVKAMTELSVLCERVQALLVAGKFAESRRYLAMMPQSEATLQQRLQVLEHGDLNVDKIVLSAIPEQGWINIPLLESQLQSFDYRLRQGLYRPLGEWLVSPRTPVNVVIDRLVESGLLKQNATGRQVRRAKAGDKD